ncbi:MAG: heparinase II/III-family protein [Phycisphaerae bacterium]|nr:heparinase II/III-family protein [Phycisphaerae bacterium]
MRSRLPVLLIAFVSGLLFNGFESTSSASAGVTASPGPNLYYTSQRLEALKDRIDKNPVFGRAWADLLERADRLVTDDLVSKAYAESGQGQHGNYGRPSSQMSTLGATLGLAYRMTAEPKYAVKLREAMLHYAGLNRWAGDAQQDPPWHSELNTARFCFGYGIGFDSIRDTLSTTDRRSIVRAMVDKGIKPTLDDWILGDRRIHALDSMGHNWWSVCVAMAGVASLSILEDEPGAEAWVSELCDAFPEWFAYQGNILQNKSPNFDAQGAFYESVNYANYALSEYLLFHLAYTNVFPERPLPEIPLLKTAGDFFVNTAYPTSESVLSVNFGDSSLTGSGARTLRLLLANGFDDPSYHWYITRTDTGLTDPLGLVYHQVRPHEEATEALANACLYPDIGWAMMRSSWQDDATLLAVKSGFTWNHAHPDAGSFILFHGGKPLIIDSGNCSYSRPEYSAYYRHSRAHNVILQEGQAQLPEDCGNGDRGVVHPGQVGHLMDLAGIRYVLADATGPTSWKFSRNYRHVVWVDDVILIVDDVRTHEPGQLEWLLHFEGQAQAQGSDVTLSNGPTSRAIVRPLFPRDMSLIRRQGLKDHDPDTKVEYLAWLPTEKSRDMKFITAIMPLRESREKPQVEVTLLEGDEMLGVRLSGPEHITEVFLNLRADGRRMHRNSNKLIHGWDTDAYLFGVTRPVDAPDSLDSVTRSFVVCGSYVRRNGQSLLGSLSKVYAIASDADGTFETVLQGQPIIRCAMRAKVKPEKTVLNGEPVPAEWAPASQTVEFRVNARP